MTSVWISNIDMFVDVDVLNYTATTTGTLETQTNIGTEELAVASPLMFFTPPLISLPTTKPP